jgi:hypothetical protein
VTLKQHAAQLMREGPSESGNRPRLQTTRSCARVTARVVKVRGKGEHKARQVTPQKTNKSEPPMRCRNRIVAAIETRLQSRAWDKVWEVPVFGPDGGRHGGGVSWERGNCVERGNLARGCQGRTARGQDALKWESTDALRRDGSARSSDEVCESRRSEGADMSSRRSRPTRKRRSR